MFGFFKKKKETRSISTGNAFLGYSGGITGEGFDPMSIPALNQAVDCISSSVASLPLTCAKNSAIDKILKRPNDKQNSYDFVNTIMRSLLINANAYIEKQYTNGVVSGLVAHHYSQVSVERVGFDFRYRISDVFGRMTVLLSHEVIHIRQNSKDKYFGTSKVDECARAIELAIKQSMHASN